MTTVKEEQVLPEELQTRINFFHTLGIPTALLATLKNPCNIPQGANYEEYTVHNSITDMENNTNNWKGKQINGILIKGGYISEGKLEGYHCDVIDIDTEKAYNQLLEGTNLEEIKPKYWVEDHQTPYYRLRMIIVSKKGFPYISEKTKLSNGEDLGIGVFSNNKQWGVVSPSLNSPSGKKWRLSEGSKERIDPLSDQEYEELYQRIKRVCKINGVPYGEENNNNKNKSPVVFNGHSKQKPVIYGESNDHESHSELNGHESQSNNIDFLVDNSIRLLKPLYHEPNREDIALYYSGACVHKDHDKSIPLTVLQRLVKETNDEEPKKRIDTIEGTYNKASKEGKKNVKGLKGLEGVFTDGGSNPNFKYLKAILSVKTNGEGEEYEKECSDFDKILELTENNLLYFKDQFGNPYIHVDNINIRLSTKSSKIRNYLIDICWNSEYNFSPSIETLNKVIYHFESQADRKDIVYPLELRCATDPDNENVWYYDMGDSIGRSLRISAEGWEIVDKTPIIFRRYMDVETEQVEPNRNYTEDIFDKLLESCFYITNEDIKLLLKVYIIDLFIPNTQKPFLMFHGVQDAGKSMKMELIKMIADPNPILTHHLPNDLKDLIRILSHNYVVYFDNVSGISPENSDTFCRGVTGAGHSDRFLYTDEDDRLTRFKRAIGCNGINLGSDRGDLLSRAININFEGIKDNLRKDPKEIWKEFESLKPYLLGYIFDMLVRVLKLKKEGVTTKVNKFNRMIEFQKNGEFISMLMGKEDGKFSSIYDNLVNSQNVDIVENDPVANAIVYLSESAKGIYKNTPTETLNEIKNHIIVVQKIDYNKVQLPTKPNKVTNLLNPIN